MAKRKNFTGAVLDSAIGYGVKRCTLAVVAKVVSRSAAGMLGVAWTGYTAGKSAVSVIKKICNK
jgi:hypothetical protein